MVLEVSWQQVQSARHGQAKYSEAESLHRDLDISSSDSEWVNKWCEDILISGAGRRSCSSGWTIVVNLSLPWSSVEYRQLWVESHLHGQASTVPLLCTVVLWSYPCMYRSGSVAVVRTCWQLKCCCQTNLDWWMHGSWWYAFSSLCVVALRHQALVMLVEL